MGADLLTLDIDPCWPVVKPRALRHNRISAMAEVQEVVIDYVVLFYEEGQGGVGGNYRKKNKFRCRVNMQEKRLVKFREAIW